MKVLLTGAGGQVGRALAANLPTGAVLTALDRAALDITDAAAVARAVDAAAPALIINAAAYTAVDRAESDEERAYAINAAAVGHLVASGVPLVHISTDFVFDGRASTPYAPDAKTAPLSAYGRSKLAGEQAAEGALIVRTAWVYAARGANFVHTMLHLMRTRDELRVVADQIGAPTLADGLARVIWGLAMQGQTGIWHYTDSGAASWYDFAVAIMEEALAIGLIARPVPIIPIRTADYPTPARRPAYSVLDCAATAAALHARLPHWRTGLRAMLLEVKANG